MTRNEVEELKEFLAETPARILRLVESFSSHEIHLKPAADEFSVVENICHLRDIEVDGYAARIEKILTEDEPFLPDLNGARLAAERRYNEQQLEPALKAFTGARQDNLSTIKELTSEQMERRGVFENTGAITLCKLLLMMREHDVAHLNELKTLRDKLSQPS